MSRVAHRGRPTKVLVGVAAAVTALMLTACTSPNNDTPNNTRQVPDKLFEHLNSGELYLVLGAPGSGNVWKVDLSNRTTLQMTSNPERFGISWLSASSAGVVLSDARKGIDNLAVLTDNGAEELPEGHAGTPAISTKGEIVYVAVPDVVNKTGPGTFRIMVKENRSAPPVIRYEQQGPDIAGLSWGPEGQLAATSAPGQRYAKNDQPEILIIGADGRVVQRLHPPLKDLANPVWSPTASGIAIGQVNRTENPSNSLFLTLTGEQVEIPSGWRPGCWTPNGQQLVVKRGNDIGLWAPQQPKQVIELGAVANGPVLHCALTSSPAT